MAPILHQTLHTLTTLSKRGNDDIGGIPKWALVILIMLASGVVVVCVYGILRHMTPEKPVEKSISAEQADYMREVRERNLNGLMAEFAHKGAHRR